MSRYHLTINHISDKIEALNNYLDSVYKVSDYIDNPITYHSRPESEIRNGSIRIIYHYHLRDGKMYTKDISPEDFEILDKSRGYLRILNPEMNFLPIIIYQQGFLMFC